MHYNINYIKTLWTESNNQDLKNVISHDLPDLWNYLTSTNAKPSFNMTIGQNFESGEYTFRQGYYLAFKATIQEAYKSPDSDSMGVAAIFLARHYIELCLKDSIFDLNMVLGNDIQIYNNRNGHELDVLLADFKRLMGWESGKLDVGDENFITIIEIFDKLSSNNDEYRYATDNQGNLHIPIETDPSNQEFVFNLEILFLYVHYIHVYFNNLFYILSDDGSIMAEQALNNPFVIAFVHFIVGSKAIYSKRHGLSAAYVNAQIKNFPYSHEVNAISSGSQYPFQISLNGKNFFTINKIDDNIFISTNC
ncbi:hypothetical protein EQZ98_05740 [Leuconostoc mesenteroides]|uniref:hypothetical protein n=1 Tax=Leuconostoc mesenteroides TaxID=1245 RepID=UPI000DAADBDF|nr:hypothetical protein [Leuconostoc mesenteroides]AWV37892.1 hypothetical protein CD198_05200 [Leuconostoc mesenteroides]MCU4664794.1 hypothetical protein [Leuconostoc mesenteroides]QAT27649.1 hypothetical protein EQZ98_05740 [Leuconostoc mesenteroides]